MYASSVTGLELEIVQELISGGLVRCPGVG
jgi:hypothetical protein